MGLRPRARFARAWSSAIIIIIIIIIVKSKQITVAEIYRALSRNRRAHSGANFFLTLRSYRDQRNEDTVSTALQKKLNDTISWETY